MAVREDLLQAFRTWMKTELSLTDSQVVLAKREQGGDQGPRPSLPYLYLTLPSHDIPRGVDEIIWQNSLTKVYRGNRAGTLRVEAKGPDSEELLHKLGMFVSEFDGPATVINQGNPIVDVSAYVGADEEGRYYREFPIEYGVQLTKEFVGATKFQATANMESGEDTITKVITVELSP